MGWLQFSTWAIAKGFRHKKLLLQAYNSFKKFPGKDAILKKAKNLLDDLIKKTPTKDIADKVRQSMKKRPFPGFKPTIVPKTKIVPKKPNPLGDALKAGKYKKVPTPKKLTPKTEIKDLQKGPHVDSRGRVWPKFVKPKPKGPAKIIPFPKKPPHLKAGGGSVDKALPKKSRDI